MDMHKNTYLYMEPSKIKKAFKSKKININIDKLRKTIPRKKLKLILSKE